MMLSTPLRTLAVSVTTFALLPVVALAEDDFVPFVIPARTPPDSAIAFGGVQPIRPDAPRLTVRDGHFHDAAGRVRLWGVNLSFSANWPREKDAAQVARRLAAAGINSVRLHHMDTSRWPRGLWNRRDGKTIEPEAIERLDRFIAELARHGIRIDLNLHVGREHSRALGLPEANRKYDKIACLFTPALIDAQKDFARQLLGHVNPHRKRRWADDPAIAIVEITNENSFFMWSSEETLRTLPPYYATILSRRYADWLRRRYDSTTALRAAWSRGIEPAGANLLTGGAFDEAPADGKLPASWSLEQHDGCRASASVGRFQERPGLCVKLERVNETTWHIQLKQPGFAVEAGVHYSLRFRAASAKPRSITCGVSQAHAPWGGLGLSRRIELLPQWKSFRIGFDATKDDGNARLSFSLGGDETTVWLADVELRRGGQEGLRADEALKAGNIALFADEESPMRTADRALFLAATEKSYFDELRRYVREDLGCRALVTGTIVFGPLGLWAQSDMDFIDAHAYWQHPRFPGRPWDAGNWLVEQQALVDHPDRATLFRLAAERLAGKPFTVSEYNHPAPLDSQADCVPLIAAFGALQDWDGIWLYSYSHSDDAYGGQHVTSFFDMHSNPAKWGFVPTGAAIFRDRAIGALQSSRVVPLGSMSVGPGPPGNLATLQRAHDTNLFAAAKQRWQDVLANRFAVGIDPAGNLRTTRENRRPRVAWDVDDAGRGIFAAHDRGSWSCAGHAPRFDAATRGAITIESPRFAAVTVAPLDGQPVARSRKILITACGRCENVGMEFSTDRRTVGRGWGGPPVRIEAVTGAVKVDAGGSGEWSCHALAPDGRRLQRVTVAARDDAITVPLSPRHATMWYLLER